MKTLTNMKLMTAAAIVAAISLTAGCAAPSSTGGTQTGTVRVSRHAFCTRIKDKEPAGTARSFRSNVGKVYLWTLIEGVQTPTTLRHVWYYEGERWLEIPLKITSARFRTWSYFTIRPELTGTWRVRVEKTDGTVLGSYKFTVRK